MTAQEWLEELETKAMAATPGPYILDGMYPIYSLGRGGLKDKTIACANSQFDGDYMAAACNALPRLIAMLRVLSEEASGEVTCLGSNRYLVNTPENLLQKAYEATEEACPKK